MLAGPQTTLVKQRALFVLSQIDSLEAREILVQTARIGCAARRGHSQHRHRRRPESADGLQAIYNAGSPEVKDEVMQAWMIAGHKDAVYQAALNAKTEEEANQAPPSRGNGGATDELRKPGDRPNAASGLVDAYAMSGDLASLRKIAEGGGNRATQIDAVRKIGIIQTGCRARRAAGDLFALERCEIREAALQGTC